MARVARFPLQGQNENIRSKDGSLLYMPVKGSMETITLCPLQDQNLNILNKGSAKKVEADGLKAQKKAGAGARKALANITNSGKPSSHEQSKKIQPKKLAKKGIIPTTIDEERCLHNHQCCTNLRTNTSTVNLLQSMIPFDDEKSPLELWSPRTPSTLRQSKVDLTKTPMHLEFTQSPLSLKTKTFN